MRNPFQIDSDDVAALSKDDLPRLMNRLLGLEARHCHISPSDVETSLRVNDPDGGIDARIRSNAINNFWLPQGLSVWQFKAGSNITASALSKEVKKPGVRQGLASGGTYCLVVSADFIPKKIDEVKNWLDEAIAEVQPDAPHILLTASLVAQWATEHPSMLFGFSRPVYGIWSLEAWLQRQPMHRIPFQQDEMRAAIMKEVPQRLASDAGPLHVRIQGASGVGKTRLALETFHSSQEGLDLALYASEPPGNEFFYWMASHADTTATLVVDECLPAQAVQMSSLAQMSEGRLHLVTVGPAQGLGSDLDVYGLSPLHDTVLASVVEATVPTLSYEQVRWIVRVAKGYVKLAVALARKVAQGQMTVVGLTTTFEVGQLLQGLLPDERFRQAMKGLALLTRVGWDEEVSSDGKILAHFIGMPWEAMRDAIGQAMREGLVSKQGRYRYVTPELLALWLAADEWQARQRDVLKLLEEFPRAEARNALVERLVQLAGIQEVSQIIEDLLKTPDLFDDLTKLNDERIARIFSVLSKGHGHAACEILERVLFSASPEQLLAFTQGRRYILQTLERLAWRKETFPGAARLLLRLAEAENQTWSNNATGVWTGLFLIHKGATEVPVLERYPLLQEALQSDVPARRKLTVVALSKALALSEVGNALGEEHDGYVPLKRWSPATWEEERAARKEALRLLDMALADTDEQVQKQAREVLCNVARGLVVRGLAEEIIDRFEKLEVHDDNQRRSVWATIQTILKYEVSSLTEDQHQRFASRAEYFLGSSLRERIHRYVGRPTVVDIVGLDRLPEDQRPPAVVTRLTDEAVKEPDVLRGELSWLMSRDAEYAWHFGYRLGERDEEHAWLEELVEVAKASQESLLLSAYLQGRADAGESEWRERLLDEWMDTASYAPLIFDALWRTTANTRAVERLIQLVDQGALAPATLSRLVPGGWVGSLDAADVSLVLERLARDTSPNVSEAGLALLTQWVEAQKPEGIPASLMPFAWLLVERTVTENTPMLDFYWRQVGLTLLQQDPVRMTQVVLRGVAIGTITFIDERLAILKRAFLLKPAEIWEVFANQLLTYEELSYGLREWFQGNAILDELDADTLLAWARQEPEQRSKLLARLVKPKEIITPLVRGLVREYGPESPVANILVANFNTGFWSGHWVQHEEQRLETMHGWSRDPEPNIRLWAQRQIASTQQHLRDIRRMEEEGWPYPT